MFNYLVDNCFIVKEVAGKNGERGAARYVTVCILHENLLVRLEGERCVEILLVKAIGLKPMISDKNVIKFQKNVSKKKITK
jgi:hypothetical protein